MLWIFGLQACEIDLSNPTRDQIYRCIWKAIS